MIRSRSIGTLLASAAAIPLAAIAVAGCGGGSNSSGSTTPTTISVSHNGQPATVSVATSSLGKILVDAQGRTLYLFKKDSGTTSECTGQCATFWPPLTVTDTPTAGAGTTSTVSTTTRSDGKTQVVYNGHPLYTYSGDNQAGDTSGEGVTAFGGGWFALSGAGNQVSGPASSSGSGSGY